MSVDDISRSLSGLKGAHVALAKYAPELMTRAANAANWRKYLDQVDPKRELPEAERMRRAESARKAYMVGLALKRWKKAAPGATMPEAEKKVGIGRTIAYRALQQGRVPCRKIFGRWLISRAAIDAWLAGEMGGTHGNKS
jgi:predicted DNA-binding transcriptional regulator AlpA